MQHTDLKKKKKIKDQVFTFCNYILFAILSILCAYPFYYLILNSISANDLSAHGLVNFVPKGIHFQNYLDMLQR